MANSDTKTQPWHPDRMFAFNSRMAGNPDITPQQQSQLRSQRA